MTTTRQDQDFIRTVISEALLEDAISWISRNMSPEDVFDDRALATWAEDRDYIRREDL